MLVETDTEGGGETKRNTSRARQGIHRLMIHGGGGHVCLRMNIHLATLFFSSPSLTSNSNHKTSLGTYAPSAGQPVPILPEKVLFVQSYLHT